MDDLHWFNFSALPHSEGGFSKLFTDYVNEYHKVQQYFETDFHSIHNFPKHAERLKPQIRHRAALVEVLREQNAQFGASQKTNEHIDQLAEENTFAIVTGQQVGILSGPLYTIYKTITAIKLSQLLGATFPDYKFVPVFWLEGEDHDFEEVNHVGLLNAEHTPVKVEYHPAGRNPVKNMGPVGAIEFDGSLELFFDQIRKTLPNSEFKESVLALLTGIYAAGSTFNNSFARLLNTFFPEAGLVFVSSNDKRLKQLMAPIFLKEIQQYPRVSQLIIARSAELENRYHAQIKPKAMNLFLFSKGGRYFIEPRENDFSLKGTRQYVTKDELMRIVSETPEMLSPNVALRPICQDTILPTLAYVSGPSEIAYFAQLRDVYSHFGIVMPIIYPRASLTIVEEKQQRVMEKYEFDLLEFFGDGERMSRKVVQMLSEIKIDDMFKDASRRVSELLDEMRFGMNYIDSTLLGSLDTVHTKIDSQLDFLKEKVVEAQKRKHEIALRQVSKAVNSIFPNDGFQERELSIVHFMNKHGLEFVQRLYDQVEINRFQHQILKV